MGAARRTPARKHVAPAYHRPGAREFAFSAGARSEQQVPLRLPVERQRQRRIDRERHLVAAPDRRVVFDPHGQIERRAGGVPTNPATNALTGWSWSSWYVPICSIRPPRMTAMRSASAIASTWSWVT